MNRNTIAPANPYDTAFRTLELFAGGLVPGTLLPHLVKEAGYSDTTVAAVSACAGIVIGLVANMNISDQNHPLSRVLSMKTYLICSCLLAHRTIAPLTATFILPAAALNPHTLANIKANHTSILGPLFLLGLAIWDKSFHPPP